MPAPAHRCARLPASTPERIATASSPLPSRSNQPTGAAYQPRATGSCDADPVDRDLARRAAHRRRRVQPRRELEDVPAAAQPGGERRVEVDDVAQDPQVGLGGRVDVGAAGERGADRVDDQGVLAAILVARRSSAPASATIRSRIPETPEALERRATRRPARRRVTARLRVPARASTHTEIAVEAHQPLRRGGDQRAGVRRLHQHARAVGVA